MERGHAQRRQKMDPRVEERRHGRAELWGCGGSERSKVSSKKPSWDFMIAPFLKVPRHGDVKRLGEVNRHPPNRVNRVNRA
jgi:hypothetical protein